jgi:hypothetical protein
VIKWNGELFTYQELKILRDTTLDVVRNLTFELTRAELLKMTNDIIKMDRLLGK